MNSGSRWAIGFFIMVVVATVSLAVTYPEDFAIALGFLVLGFAGGMLIATTLMKTYFSQGANMVHELQKKQIINPATIIREARLQEKQDKKSTQPQPVHQQAIPRFNKTTGFDQ